MSQRLIRQLVAGGALVVLVVIGALLPVPYVALSPGPVYDTLGDSGGQPLITISGASTYPTEGRLDLTTVSENGGPGRRMSLVQSLVGWVRPAVAVLPEDLLYPPDTSPEDVQQQNTVEMVDSKEAATVAALRQAGVPVTTTVEVASVEAGGPSDGVLKADDVIDTVNGTTVRTPDQLREQMAKVDPGEDVRLTITRDDTKQQVVVTTGKAPDDPNRALLGIVPRQGYDSAVTVDIQLDNVGGPSAGLMFALGIYDKLTPGPLTGGRHVAGTGTMSVDGAVGAIGGIEQKMIAARRHGATVFFVPKDNCAEAVPAAPSGLRLVRADSLEAATHALEDLDAKGDSAQLPSCG